MPNVRGSNNDVFKEDIDRTKREVDAEHFLVDANLIFRVERNTKNAKI